MIAGWLSFSCWEKKLADYCANWDFGGALEACPDQDDDDDSSSSSSSRPPSPRPSTPAKSSLGGSDRTPAKLIIADRRRGSDAAENVSHFLGRTGRWGTLMRVVEVALDGVVVLADTILVSDNGLSNGLQRLHRDLSLTRRVWLPPYRIALGASLVLSGPGGPSERPQKGTFAKLDGVCGWTLMAVNALALVCLADKQKYISMASLRRQFDQMHKLLDWGQLVVSAVSAVDACHYGLFLNVWAHSPYRIEDERDAATGHGRAQFFSGVRYSLQMVAGICKIAGWKDFRKLMRTFSAFAIISQFIVEPRDSLDFNPSPEPSMDSNPSSG